MIEFSTDAQVAEQQMEAIIFYLTTFGYIDGDFDDSEKAFVREYISKLVKRRIETGMPDAEPRLAEELHGKFTAHFLETFERIDLQVRDLFTEAVARDEDQDAFIHAKLKLRCFEIFQNFDRSNQERLLDAMDEIIEADGTVHPAEQKFRNELVALFEDDLDIELLDDDEAGSVAVNDAAVIDPVRHSHPFFDQFEFHYSADQSKIMKQIDADRSTIDEVLGLLEKGRTAAAGKLKGKQSVAEFAGEQPFIDGHVIVHPIEAGKRYELVVLGDLHGCYSVLKGAVMQSEFFDKVKRYRESPDTEPKPLLVLLGDYIDRGLFSLNGVLRTVMQLYTAAPDHVVVLRGNHEYYLEYKGQIFGGVKPAEAINTLKPHLPIDVFRHYMRFFESMPNVLLFDRFFFVHGGIPRDSLLKERYEDLSSLNDKDMRFQMMWSDPSEADVIPAALQEQSARFPFGKLQAAAFLQKLGCHTLIRGHEKVTSGFHRHYEDPITLITLFSSGGHDNGDLPEGSSYRSVTPKALTIEIDGEGSAQLTPWDVDYRTFNDPEFNRFFQTAPEIALKR